MQLYFIRHAQSQNNAIERSESYLSDRFEDPSITELGWKQAAVLADFLAAPERSDLRTSYRNPWNHDGFRFTHVYCSLQRRAVETARVVCDKIGVAPNGWAAIHETGGVIRYDQTVGGFVGSDGATPDQLRSWNPSLRLGDDARENGWWQRKPMEQDSEVRARAREVYQTLLDRHGKSDDQVVIVSHGTFYNYLLATILGLELRNELWFPLHNCGMTRFDIADGEDFEPGMDAAGKKLDGLPVRVAYANRLDHIPPALIS